MFTVLRDAATGRIFTFQHDIPSTSTGVDLRCEALSAYNVSGGSFICVKAINGPDTIYKYKKHKMCLDWRAKFDPKKTFCLDKKISVL